MLFLTLIAVGATVWIVAGILCAEKASRNGLLHPIPEIAGIGYCCAVIGGPLGHRLLRR